MLTHGLERFSRVRDLGWSIALVVGMVLLGSIAGAATGIAPLIVVPIGVAAAAALLISLGTKAARAALGSVTGWHGLVLLTLWLLVVNVPTFLAFDQTGFTREYGLFNPQSVSRIAVFGLAAFALLAFWLLWGRGLASRGYVQPPRGAWLLFALYIWYLVTSPLATRGMPLALSTFRVLEWIIAIALLCMAFAVQSSTGRRSFTERARLVWPVVAFLVLSNLVLLPVLPNVIYQASAITGVRRLGGFFTHPNLLAVAATLVLAYALAFHSRWRRVLYSAVAIAVVLLTYSRGGYAALVATVMLALLLLLQGTGKKLVLLLLAAGVSVPVILISDVNDAMLRYLARGNESTGLATLSERTIVWQAARTQIARSPWLGEGFISGPKRLGEIMVGQRLSRNFAAPHAHNEVLQAQISGGIVATLLALAIHLRIGYLLLTSRILNSRERFFGCSVFACCLVWGALAPSLSYFLSLPGVLLAWLLLSLEGLGTRPLKEGQQAATASDAT